ncbi:MAG: hypothetical protein U1E65_25865 [Myxococcota bacterium]
MSAERVEVCILGGSLSAVALAAVLSKRGIRTAIVDQGELQQRVIPELGFWDERSAAADLVLNEAGIAFEIRQKMRRLEPMLQVILPDERLELPPERSGMLLELSRGLSRNAANEMARALEQLETIEAEGADFLAEVGELPPTGFFRRRKAERAAERYARALADMKQTEALAGDVGRILMGFLPFFTHLDVSATAPISAIRMARIAGRILRGLVEYQGDRSPHKMLLEVAEKGGAKLETTATSRVEVVGKQIHAALTKDGHAIVSEILVDASADLSGLRTISHKQRPKALAVLLEEATPKGEVHGLEIEVDRAVVPPPLGENALLMNGRRDPRPNKSGELDAEDRPILLHLRPHKSDPKRVRVIALHPISRVTSQSEGLEHLEQVMTARVERAIPFLKEGAPKIHALSPRGGHSLHPLFDPELDPIAHVSAVPARTALKNVFVAGPSVLPGLGAEGQYLVTLDLADEIEGALRKSKRTPLTERLKSRAHATAAIGAPQPSRSSSPPSSP